MYRWLVVGLVLACRPGDQTVQSHSPATTHTPTFDESARPDTIEGSFRPNTLATIANYELMDLTVTRVKDSVIATAIWLRAPSKVNGDRYQCDKALITSDSIHVTCPTTPVGSLVVTGSLRRGTDHVAYAFDGYVSMQRAGRFEPIWRGQFVAPGID
jgi:hypothetical protein